MFVDPSKIENEIILSMINFDLFVEVNLLEVKLKFVVVNTFSYIHSNKLNFDHHN